MNKNDFVSLFSDSTNKGKSSSGQYTREDYISMFADSVEQNSDSKTQESPTEPQTTQSITTGGQNQQNTSKKDRDLLAYQYDSLVGLGVVPSAEQTVAKQMQESEQNSMQLAAQAERQNYSDEDLVSAYAQPNVKLSDYQLDTAKELVKGFEAKYPKAQSFDPINGTDQESAYQYAAMMNDPQYQEYLQLKNKVDGFSSFTTGLTEGTGIPELIHFAGFTLGDDEDKAAMDAWRDDRNTVSAAGSVQNPIAYGAGYLGGKMAEYAVGRDALKAVPGVGNALQKLGTAANTALNSGTKAGAVLSTLFPAERITGIASDQILDLLLDTTPQVAEDIMRMNRQQREGVERCTPGFAPQEGAPARAAHRLELPIAEGDDDHGEVQPLGLVDGHDAHGLAAVGGGDALLLAVLLPPGEEAVEVGGAAGGEPQHDVLEGLHEHGLARPFAQAEKGDYPLHQVVQRPVPHLGQPGLLIGGHEGEGRASPLVRPAEAGVQGFLVRQPASPAQVFVADDDALHAVAGAHQQA